MGLFRYILRISASVALVSCCLTSRVMGGQNSTNASGPTQSFKTSISSQNSMGVNPIRSNETHTQNDNRTTDSQMLQRLGPDGRYEPYLDVEKETIKVDANTVRTVQRSYAYADGQRRLVQKTEEESQALSGREVKIVRTTSNPDVNGALQVVQKEVEDVKKTGPGAQETTTSVFTPDINGQLSESLRTLQSETRTDDHTVQFQKTTLLQDGAGIWQANEVRQGVIKNNGKDQTREETVSQPDSDGKMAVVRRDVSKQTTDSQGETATTSRTDSVDVPGIPRESEPHPVQQVTTTHTPGEGGRQTTMTTVQQPNPGSPTEGMQVTVRTTDTTQPIPGGGARSTRTVQSFVGGNPSAVWIDFGQSEKTALSSGNSPSQAPAQKAQPKQ